VIAGYWFVVLKGPNVDVVRVSLALVVNAVGNVLMKNSLTDLSLNDP
jgi:hypothetical protein